MEMKAYSIQELTEKTGLPRRTIHFYSQQGILPPPNGAGLGAYYDDRHLLSLLLIPVMRSQGLRLDEIRSRLMGMNLESLQTLFDQVGQAPKPAAPLPNGQAYTHYVLPAGIILEVPSGLSSDDRKKLKELIETTRRLFSNE
jgi:DNA-binding transcriptional MerR regulator